MQVEKTWIVSDGSGIQFIFQTFEGNFYISTHISERLQKITEEEAQNLIRKTEI